MPSAPSPVDWSTWTAAVPATLMFIIRDGKILLIEKKRGHGAGKINGPGGKIEPGESALESVIRETREELLITPHHPRKLGELHFAMTDCPDLLCHVFRAETFDGTPTETAEAAPMWVPLSDIPYNRMWEDDQHWLPLLVSETPFLGRFAFAGDRMLWKEIHKVSDWS